MSDDDIELVRVAYETWNEHGPAAIVPLLADDVELVDAPQIPDAGVWRGRAAAIERLEAVSAAVGGGSVHLRSFEHTDDGVLVTMQWHIPSDTGAADLGEVFHLVQVDGGRITAIRVFLTRAEAFRPRSG